MYEDQHTERLLRYSILLCELLLLTAVMWIFFNCGLLHAPAGLTTKRLYMTSTLCYIICNLGSGVVSHLPWSRPDQVVRHAFTNVATYALLHLSINLMLRSVATPHWMMGVFYGVVLVLAIINRIVWRRNIRAWRGSKSRVRNVVFVGDLDNALDLVKHMKGQKSGFHIMGCFADQRSMADDHQLTYLGIPGEAGEWILRNEGRVDSLYCTLSSSRPESSTLMRTCDNHLVHFYAIPGVRSYMYRRMHFDLVFGVPVLSMRAEPLGSPAARFWKRAFDLVCSSIFLVFFFLIIYPIVGIAIKMSSKGPVLFKQQRSGQNGKVFWCYKFRSMRLNNESDTKQATLNDPRVTRLGNFLRCSNIDELPQFINVFRGEMSMVGPRPHMLKHTEQYSQLIDKYMVRHFAKPGITGWAQVTGYRGETRELWQMEGRVEKDIWYIEHWTFTLDLYIIYKTIVNMLHRDKKAY